MIDTAPFRQLAATAPQPVALAFARVVRAPNSVEQVDAIRRAAETLTRYVATAAVSSISSVGDTGGTFSPPDDLAEGKSLAWGYFLDLARRAALHQQPHPLQQVLLEGFGLKDSDKEEQCALDDLGDLLTLRNHRSDHSLVPTSEAKAEVLLATEKVDERLLRAAHAFRGLLSLPLVVIAGSRYENRQHVWQCLPYVGANEPFAVDVPGRFEADTRLPYLALRRQLLSLSPGLVWKVDTETYQATFYFLDRLGETSCAFRSLLADRMLPLDVDDTLDPAAWLRGDPQPTDSFEPTDGRSLRATLFGAPTADANTAADTPEAAPAEPASSAQRSAPSASDSPPGPRPAGEAAKRLEAVNHLRRRADDLDLGTQFGQLLDATAAVGLAHQPFKHGVMVAPPSHRNRFLLWLKIVGNRKPYLKVTSSPPAVTEFYPQLPEDRVRAELGPDRRVYAGDSVDDLVESVARLFEPTRADPGTCD